MTTALAPPEEVSTDTTTSTPSPPANDLVVAPTPAPIPPLTPGLQIARGVLVTLAVLLVSFLAQLLIVSRFQHAAAQQLAFEDFRYELAIGTAPTGPTDPDGEPLERGTSVALLQIPAIGLEQVVGEGTEPSTLYDGPGHRVDTMLPGQIGTSVILGRRAAYGGPFGSITELRTGDVIVATTGQGTFEYSVIGVRREGDPLPPPAGPGFGRLTLVTADGPPFVPTGVVRVDADLVGQAVVGTERLVDRATLTSAEEAMGADHSMLWRLAMWLQALVVVSIAAIWCWHRWHRAKTWVVAIPVLAVVGLATAGEVARHLPNLL